MASHLHGRQIGNEITKEEENLALEAGLLVVFGYSDDNVELRGMISDEFGVSNGSEIYIAAPAGVFTVLPELEDNSEEQDVLEKYGVLDIVKQRFESALKIEVGWCKSQDYCWTYQASVPVATFVIVEGGEPWCLGIVIDLKV